MIDSILTKLEDVSSRYNEIETLLSQPDVTANQEEYIKLSKEYADLTPVVSVFSAFKKAEEDIEEARILMKDLYWEDSKNWYRAKIDNLSYYYHNDEVSCWSREKRIFTGTLNQYNMTLFMKLPVLGHAQFADEAPNIIP